MGAMGPTTPKRVPDGRVLFHHGDVEFGIRSQQLVGGGPTHGGPPTITIRVMPGERNCQIATLVLGVKTGVHRRLPRPERLSWSPQALVHSVR